MGLSQVFLLDVTKLEVLRSKKRSLSAIDTVYHCGLGWREKSYTV